MYLEISDSVKTTELTFWLFVINSPPTTTGSVSDLTLDFDEEFNVYITSDLFEDSDNDTLSYDVLLLDNGTEFPAPSWLSYVPEQGLITGTISQSVTITYYSNEERYY